MIRFWFWFDFRFLLIHCHVIILNVCVCVCVLKEGGVTAEENAGGWFGWLAGWLIWDRIGNKSTTMMTARMAWKIWLRRIFGWMNSLFSILITVLANYFIMKWDFNIGIWWCVCVRVCMFSGKTIKAADCHCTLANSSQIYYFTLKSKFFIFILVFFSLYSVYFCCIAAFQGPNPKEDLIK